MTVLFLLLVAVSAHAGEPVKVKFQLLPPGQEMVLGKSKAHCYLLEEWLQLAAADSELYALRGDNENLREIIRLFQEKQKSLIEVNRSLMEGRSLTEERIKALEGSVKDCRARLASCGTSTPWVIAILGGTIGVIGAAIAVGLWIGT